MKSDDILKADLPIIPRHIAIIMDGNGRWAKLRRLPRTAGHKAGFDNFVDTVDICNLLGVSYFTVYAFSTENWKREKGEVDDLLRLMNNGIKRYVPDLMKKNIQLRLLGDLSMFSEKDREVLNKSVETLKNNTGMVLAICLSYGGRSELVHAFNELAKQGKSEITEQDIEQNLYSSGMPDPDLIIRTSGEYRVSNFLLWQSAYSEYYFSNEYWPDFKKEQLYAAIRDFASRTRRYGK